MATWGLTPAQIAALGLQPMLSVPQTPVSDWTRSFGQIPRSTPPVVDAAPRRGAVGPLGGASTLPTMEELVAQIARQQGGAAPGTTTTTSGLPQQSPMTTIGPLATLAATMALPSVLKSLSGATEPGGFLGAGSLAGGGITQALNFLFPKASALGPDLTAEMLNEWAEGVSGTGTTAGSSAIPGLGGLSTGQILSALGLAASTASMINDPSPQAGAGMAASGLGLAGPMLGASTLASAGAGGVLGLGPLIAWVDQSGILGRGGQGAADIKHDPRRAQASTAEYESLAAPLQAKTAAELAAHPQTAQLANIVNFMNRGGASDLSGFQPTPLAYQVTEQLRGLKEQYPWQMWTGPQNLEALSIGDLNPLLDAYSKRLGELGFPFKGTPYQAPTQVFTPGAPMPETSMSPGDRLDWQWPSGQPPLDLFSVPERQAYNAIVARQADENARRQGYASADDMARSIALTMSASSGA